MGHLSAYITSHLGQVGINLSEFGRQVGIAKSSAKYILDGTSIPEERTLRKIHAAFPALPLARLREEALRDTPVDWPEGTELLDLDERNLVKATIRQLLKSSGKAERVQSPQSKETDEPQHLVPSNVVTLQRPEHVKKAAYDPPAED